MQSHLDEADQRGVVFAGPVYAVDDPEYRGYRIPQAFWKILVTAGSKDGSPRAAAFLLRQRLRIEGEEIEARVEPFDPIDSRIAISDLARLTGLQFPGLSDDLASPF